MEQNSKNKRFAVSSGYADDGSPPAMAVREDPGSVQHGGGGDDIPPMTPDAGEGPIGPNNWKSFLLRDDKGRLRIDALENAILYLEHQFPAYFALNEFADEVFMIKCPVWGDARTFKARRIRNDDIIRMTALLERQGLSPSTKKTHDAVMTCARKFSFHPARNYFDALEWDGLHRLGTWLKIYLGSPQNWDYLNTIGTMWMVAAVRRIYRPGTKFDHMLVLEGKTNAGKSTALRTLATFGRDEPEDYFCDSVALNEINEKAAIAVLQGKLIVEFQELDGMNKKDDTSLKRWITLQVDEVQKKYENTVTAYPRQFVLAGTTNEDTWLRDPTGNRRYWPVKVGSHIDLAGLARDREQLWAEAVHLHKAAAKIWLSDDHPVYALAQIEQASRITADAWETPILNFVDRLEFVTCDQVLKEIVPQTEKHDANMLRRIGAVLRLHEWIPDQRRVGGKAKRGWRKDIKQEKLF